MIKFLIILSLISINAIRIESTGLSGLSKSGFGGFSFKIRDETGNEKIYIKGVGDKNGMAATYEVLKHPTDKNQHVIITEATDGREILIKNVYDYNGNKLIDCDIRMNENDVAQFFDQVDTKAAAFLQKHGLSKSMELPESNFAMFDLKMNIPEQVARCENFLQQIVREEPMPPETDSEAIEFEDDKGDEEKKRKKRSYLIWPGTNWCGKGSKAEFAQSYGENVEADQCCQKHDQCPYIIQGFTTRYNLFNYRMHTLSVCECDDKFMSCLKSANTSTATMVGKVYFNVVNTECFDLKLQKTCAKRSWWGGCEKYATKWVATMRSLGNFPELDTI